MKRQKPRRISINEIEKYLTTNMGTTTVQNISLDGISPTKDHAFDFLSVSTYLNSGYICLGVTRDEVRFGSKKFTMTPIFKINKYIGKGPLKRGGFIGLSVPLTDFSSHHTSSLPNYMMNGLSGNLLFRVRSFKEQVEEQEEQIIIGA